MTARDLGIDADQTHQRWREADAAVTRAARDIADILANGRQVLPGDKAVTEYRTLRRSERIWERKDMRAREAYRAAAQAEAGAS